MKKSDGTHKTNLSVNAEINLKPVPTARYSKAPSSFYYAVTSQGERSVTLGISPLNSHNDSHRVDGVSLETDGIVVAMTYPENH
ncbi:MAG: hypothetical protein IKB16_02850, partial [Lentisphaeria bacterium]|nr:hypothetical protein [Lentisphaeria bacterium]